MNDDWLFRALFDLVDHAIFVCDLDGKIVEVNQQAIQSTGYERDELLRLRVADFDVDEVDSGAFLALGRELQTATPAKLRSRHRRKDGTSFPVDTTIVRVDSADGPRLVTMARDVTGQKEQEEARAISEERLELALDSVSDAVWDWRVDTDEVFFSTRWYTMLGYEPYALPEDFETWRELLHPEDLAASEQVIKAHLESGEPFEMEFRMAVKGGGWRWVLARGKAVERDATGNPLRMLGTHVDITDRKRSEEALKASEARWRGIIESAPLGVFIIDDVGRFVEVNPAACSITGYDQSELLSMTFRDLLAPDDRERAEGNFTHLLAEGSVDGEPTGVTKSGDRRHWSVSVVRLAEDRILGFVDDVTERRAFEDELERRVQERTRDLNKAVQLMAGREVRMAELKNQIKDLRDKLRAAGTRAKDR